MEERDILPKNFKPSEYDLELEPNLDVCTFLGKVKITFDVLKSSKIFELNSVELKIISCFVEFSNKKIQPIKTTFNTDNERVIFEFEEEINKNGFIFIEFEGILNDSMSGFYRSRYNVGNEVRNSATTQFEAVYARKSFPCFDEPAVKSYFYVTLIVPKNRLALSNMNVISTVEKGEKKNCEICKISFNVNIFISIYCR
jgi:aminopeptidase N